MIIREVRLSNFGIYGGKEVFDLSPASLNDFDRPVVLFSGKNGAGKTTILEAIRLCLHGNLAWGGRQSLAEHENYLAQRIHAPLNSDEPPGSAQVGLTLDYVSAGRKQTFRIERSWRLVQDSVRQKLDVWQDGQKLVDLKQKESLLRELVPLQIADLFFFDGEKLQMLAEDDSSSHILAATVKTLFGLNMVEQLEKDLDIYLARQTADHDAEALQIQLEELNQHIDDLKNEQADLQIKQQTNKKAMAQAKRLVAAQEQRIASEGQEFAARLDELKAARQKLEVEIEVQRRSAQELSGGLLPFAIIPQMCRRVAARLNQEKEYEHGVASQQTLKKQLEQVEAKITSSQFWTNLGVTMDERGQRKALAEIEATLKQATPSSNMDPQEVILRVSEQDRQMLLAWMDRAADEIPRQFHQTIGRLNKARAKIARVKQELALVPSDETLKPLVKELHEYNQKVDSLREAAQNMVERIQRIEYELEQVNFKLLRVREQIAERQHLDQRIQLAIKTQLAMQEYVRELGRAKTALLEKELTARFNQLCRKESLVDAVKIDPGSFKIALYRQQQRFERARLSAGEKQLLAIAIMWALREVSNVPMPVIIDTPLGRLDSDHRASMVRDYFPRASHQVILLATDTEVDRQALSMLAPVISRVYRLEYDPALGKTNVQESAASEVFVANEVNPR